MMRIIIAIIFFHFNLSFSQNNFKSFSLKSEGKKFQIDGYYNTGYANPNQFYLVIRDSIIFTFNRTDKKIYISKDYGINFKGLNYKNCFESENINIVDVFNIDENIYISCNDGYYVSSINNQNMFFKKNTFDSNLLGSRLIFFKKTMLAYTSLSLYKIENSISEKIKLPFEERILKLVATNDYLYFFISNKNSKNSSRNKCFRTKDLINWEDVKEFSFTYRDDYDNFSIDVNAIIDNKIYYTDSGKGYFIFDLLTKRKTYMQNMGPSIFNIIDNKLYAVSDGILYKIEKGIPKKMFQISGSSFKFYFNKKIGVFNNEEIIYFDKEIIKKIEDSRPKPIITPILKN